MTKYYFLGYRLDFEIKTKRNKTILKLRIIALPEKSVFQYKYETQGIFIMK